MRFVVKLIVLHQCQQSLSFDNILWICKMLLLEELGEGYTVFLYFFCHFLLSLRLVLTKVKKGSRWQLCCQHCRKKGAARRPSTWEMMVAGASVGLMMELLPIPSGLRKGATFRRARLPASHYSVAISTIISGSSLLPIADPSTTFCHCDWHLSLTASVRATALCDTMDSCLTVPELPEPSQVLDFCHLSCIFSAYRLGGRP